ncbi:hypothetical protein Tco_0708315 [Tanacetum coccineum]
MGPSLGTTQPTATITSTGDLQRATFTTPPQTALGTNTTEPPPPPIRNKGPELGTDNLTLEGVATELAPSDFVSQNYETLWDVGAMRRRRRVLAHPQGRHHRTTSGRQKERNGTMESIKNKYRGEEDEDMFPSMASFKGRRIYTAAFSRFLGEALHGFEEMLRAFRLYFTQWKKIVQNPVDLARDETAPRGDGPILPMNATQSAPSLIDKLVKEGRLDHLVKNIKEGKDKQRSGGKKDAPETRLITNLFWQGVTTSTDVIDGGASADILYEQLSKDFAKVKSLLNPADVVDWLSGRKDMAHGATMITSYGWQSGALHNSLDEFYGD